MNYLLLKIIEAIQQGSLIEKLLIHIRGIFTWIALVFIIISFILNVVKNKFLIERYKSFSQ